MISQPADDSPYRPSVAEFTPEIAALYGLSDRIGALIDAVMTGSGRKPLRIESPLRPVTEVDRARRRAEQRQHLSLVDEVKAAQERWVRSREG